MHQKKNTIFNIFFLLSFIFVVCSRISRGKGSFFMNYIELLVAVIVSTLILISALNLLNDVLLHANYIISTNSRNLRLFHILNYIRFDFIKHALSNPKTKLTNTLSSQSSFIFYEFIDGDVKKVIYKSIILPNGKCQVFRDVYLSRGSYLEFANRRIYDLSDEIKFKASQDGKFIIVTNKVYGDIIIPKRPPNVRITGIEVKKLH